MFKWKGKVVSKQDRMGCREPTDDGFILPGNLRPTPPQYVLRHWGAHRVMVVQARGGKAAASIAFHQLKAPVTTVAAPCLQAPWIACSS